jgi:hypothetical protein
MYVLVFFLLDVRVMTNLVLYDCTVNEHADGEEEESSMRGLSLISMMAVGITLIVMDVVMRRYEDQIDAIMDKCRSWCRWPRRVTSVPATEDPDQTFDHTDCERTCYRTTSS